MIQYCINRGRFINTASHYHMGFYSSAFLHNSLDMWRRQRAASLLHAAHTHTLTCTHIHAHTQPSSVFVRTFMGTFTAKKNHDNAVKSCCRWALHHHSLKQTLFACSFDLFTISRDATHSYVLLELVLCQLNLRNGTSLYMMPDFLHAIPSYSLRL